MPKSSTLSLLIRFSENPMDATFPAHLIHHFDRHYDSEEYKIFSLFPYGFLLPLFYFLTLTPTDLTIANNLFAWE
jgi:hypothetical protein